MCTSLQRPDRNVTGVRLHCTRSGGYGTSRDWWYDEGRFRRHERPLRAECVRTGDRGSCDLPRPTIRSRSDTKSVCGHTCVDELSNFLSHFIRIVETLNSRGFGCTVLRPHPPAACRVFANTKVVHFAYILTPAGSSVCVCVCV